MSPFAAKKPCRKVNCPNLVESGYCEQHKTVGSTQDRLYRGSAASRGYDRAWTKVRDQALRRDKYLCIDCLQQGIVKSAEHVHHIRKVTQHPELRLDINNTKSLCQPCHAKYTARGE